METFKKTFRRVIATAIVIIMLVSAAPLDGFADTDWSDFAIVAKAEEVRVVGIEVPDLELIENYDGSTDEYTDEETGETYGACIKCGDFGAPLNSENVVVQNNILYAEDARSILYGGNIGNAPPRFTNNRIIIPSATSDEDKGSVIARPSGTEPKLKAYLFAKGADQAAAEATLDVLEALMNRYCKA